MDSSRGSGLGLYHIQELKSPTGLGQETMCISRERADFLWEVLRNGIDQILQNSHDNSSFEEIYKCGYMLVMHKHGVILSNGLEERINNYLKYTLLEKVSRSLEPQFLSALHSYFESHISTLEVIKGTLYYFDKVYAAHNGFNDVHILGIKLFRSTILCDSVQTRMGDMLLEMVTKERRKDENMDRPLFRKITGMLMELGINSRIVYREVFEERFLLESRSFYMQESEELLKTDDFSQYLTHVESRLTEEIERSEQCFDHSTTSKIVQVVENEFITENLLGLAGMSTCVVHMVEHRMSDELARLHTRLSRVPEGLNVMCRTMSHYIRGQGDTIASDYRNTEPLVYVKNLLIIKDKIDMYSEHALGNENQLRNTLIREFEDVLNANSKSPEYIAVYLDDKVKKGEKNKYDFNGTLETLDKVMDLFTSLREKDTFHAYYKNMLAARLLFTKVNEESEKYIISKIKTECGLDFCRCFDGMLLDMERSANLTEEFCKTPSKSEDPTSVSSEGLEFSILVQTPRHWPLHAELTCKLPQNAQQALDSFGEFYMTRHDGRKLKLLPQRGSAEITFSPNDSRTYTLVAQSFQMCVLIMFNERNSWVYEDLLEVTEIPSQDLKRALMPLITMGKSSQGILVKKPNTPAIAETDSLFINASYYSKSHLVKIQSYGRTEPESDKTDMNITTEDKFIEVKAAIVRIMKKEKRLNHDVLVDFVMTALSHRFCPTVIMIRTLIETLIETEYIARDYDDRRVYSYIS